MLLGEVLITCFWTPQVLKIINAMAHCADIESVHPRLPGCEHLDLAGLCRVFKRWGGLTMAAFELAWAFRIAFAAA